MSELKMPNRHERRRIVRKAKSARLRQSFPHPCNRCGLCCLTEICPAAMFIFKPVSDKGPCPLLEWNGGESTCGLRKHLPAREADALLGIGTGCDFLGRAVDTRTGVEADFASLPDEIKTEIAQRVRTGTIGAYRRAK